MSEKQEGWTISNYKGGGHVPGFRSKDGRMFRSGPWFATEGGALAWIDEQPEDPRMGRR